MKTGHEIQAGIYFATISKIAARMRRRDVMRSDDWLDLIALEQHANAGYHMLVEEPKRKVMVTNVANHTG